MNKLNKFLFLFPILALSIWAIGAVQHINDNTISFENKISLQTTSSKEISHFVITEVEKKDFVITELEPEFEVEFDWSSVDVISCNSLFFAIQNRSIRVNKYYSSSQGVIPLYDLFCNWKFHLS